MWFLVPLVLTGGILLLSKINKAQEDLEELNPSICRFYICHSFYDNTSYKVLVKKLKLTKGIYSFNHSIPKHKQREVENDDELREVFRKQMSSCTHVFVLAKNGIPSKSYVKIELEVAKNLGKEIIAIKPKGQTNLPKFMNGYITRIISNDIRNIEKTVRRK